jgi:hypothetical protein
MNVCGNAYGNAYGVWSCVFSMNGDDDGGWNAYGCGA